MSKRAAAARDLDEQIRKLVVDLRLLEGSARIVQTRLDVVTGALNETLTATSTLEGVQNAKQNGEMLIPIGAGSFVRATLGNNDTIIMGVGANVCLERSVDESIAHLKNRGADLEKARATLQEQLVQAAGQLEEGRTRLNELLRKRGAETIEVV